MRNLAGARAGTALRIVLTAALLAVGACSDDDDTASDDTTPTEDTGAPATEDDTEVPAVDPEIAALPGGDAVSPNPDGTEPLPPLPDEVALPIVFVHGFAGSAQQYESQAMRFVANGYPQERIVAFDHDGAGVDIEAYVAGVEETVDAALAEHGTEQVYLVGHSRGTTVSTEYLADPQRAAKVAKYIAIDGRPCVEVVPCTAPNQEGHPGQAHVEVATSEESFAQQYEFLVGAPPDVTEIVAQVDPVVIEGRAVNFPANTGRDGVTLEIFEVDADTGMRVGDEPHAVFELGPDGAFGPLALQGGVHYEYALSDADSPTTHHLYPQPYLRDSHLVRLLSSPPDGDTRVNTNTGDDHTAIIAIRMREWYAEDDPDLVDDERDVLEITAGDREPVNALAVPFVGNGAIGLHLHDDAATPGETTLQALPYFSEQPFQSGIDVYMPATDPPSQTIRVTNLPRGDAADPQTINVPNWPSSTHAVSVVFTDHPVDRSVS